MAADLPTPPAELTTVAVEHCAQCNKFITPADRVAAGDRVFCRTCHEALRMELETAVTAMSEDVPYASALVGALLGGAVGVAAWWGFTVATKWSIGLIAIGVGYAVGWGTVRFAGGKRSRGLQILSAAVALLSWVAASYLVNMTFVNRSFAAKGDAFRLGVLPASFDQLIQVLSVGFGLMDVVFLAIMVWEAWKAPRPVHLPARPA
jgi:hypothetical protein